MKRSNSHKQKENDNMPSSFDQHPPTSTLTEKYNGTTPPGETFGLDPGTAPMEGVENASKLMMN